MLLVRDEKDYYKIEDLFSSDLDKQIVRDQQIYADAIGLATGLTPEQVSRSFIDVWEGYTELLLTKEQVAREMGISVPQLEQYAKLSADPLIIGLLRNPIRPVRRDQFERSYQDFMVLMLRARAGAGGPQDEDDEESKDDPGEHRVFPRSPRKRGSMGKRKGICRQDSANPGNCHPHPDGVRGLSLGPVRGTFRP
jgi:hypothetical protein